MNNMLLLQSLGVDEPLNYKEADLEKQFSDQQFDFIFDSIGGECCGLPLLKSGVNTVLAANVLLPPHGAGPATELGYHKLLKKDGCYLEISNTGTDQNRVKKL